MFEPYVHTKDRRDPVSLCDGRSHSYCAILCLISKVFDSGSDIKTI